MGYVKFQRGIDYCHFGDSGTFELMKESKKVLDAAYISALNITTKGRIFTIFKPRKGLR